MRPPAVLAVRPPDYFPTLAHAALWAHAEQAVAADTFALSRQSRHTRARIATSQGGQWLSVPRHRAVGPAAICDVRPVADGWPRRHARALQTAYGMAPLAEELLPEIAALLAAPHGSLADLTTATGAWTARRLGLPVPRRASGLPGRPATLAEVWEEAGRGPLLVLPDAARRVAEQARAFGADVLVLEAHEPRYRQAWPGFVPATAALDALLMAARPALGGVLVRADLADGHCRVQASVRYPELPHVVPFLPGTG